MLGGAANDDAEFASFASILYHHGHLLLFIEEDGIRFRTVHDTKAASLMSDTRFIYHFSNCVHSMVLLMNLKIRPTSGS
jgi:hypothetical protein